MRENLPHIGICICTCKRLLLLKRLLEKLQHLETGGLFTYSVLVADNDQSQSARDVVSEFAKASRVNTSYCIEPRQNIALARNKALEHARGDYVAFIDDDEVPEKHWLLHLFKACEGHGVDGVLGPVLPRFDEKAPEWLRKGGFYDRPRHATGFRLEWSECRTGNVLFRRQMLDRLDMPFREEFRTGGEDQDFFQRMIKAGHRFIWCNEAVVHEVVPPIRCTRRFMIKRALLRGRNSQQHRQGRCKMLAKSLVAVPLYILALPFLHLGGHHLFMKYLVKLCDHAGRLLALAGLNPVREREM